MRRHNFVMPGFKMPRPRFENGIPMPFSRPAAEREQKDLADYQPLADWYRVRLLPKVEQTPGGVWLPDTVRQNWTDARVVAAGPGARVADEQRGVMWVDASDRVLFMKHALKNFQPSSREGMVQDRDLIAVGRESSGVPAMPEPLNDWCLVEPAPPETHAGQLIVYAEEDRPRPLHGLLLAFGPGQVRLKGPLTGTRKPVHELFGFEQEAQAENLVGKAHVFWDRQCQALAIGRRELEFILIQATDLLGYRLIEDGDADDC